MRTRVYIAGPISKGCLQHNIDQARDAARRLIEAGYAPFCPQLTCFLESNAPSATSGFPHETWLDVDLPWVAVSHAVLRLSGESKGADQEVAFAEEMGIPVYCNLARLCSMLPRNTLDKRGRRSEAGHPGFLSILEEIRTMHERKAHDYGSWADPLANIRGSQDYGVPPWVGAMLRANDKVQRIKAFLQRGELKNEPVEDSLLDLAAYAAIALALRRECAEKEKES